MKLQNLSVIFVIIVIPITLILSAYIGVQIDTASLQQSYDTILMDATHDAVVAFELNTQNNAYSNNSDSIRRDIKAAINTFSTSVATSFNMTGANSENIMPYIPAILITLYDGYYIYSPSEYSYKTQNELGEEQQKTGYTHILKPYVYYTAKYVSGDNYVIVNYSLDNYIAIYGVVNGKTISNSGYLEDDEVLNNINEDGENLSEKITYRILKPDTNTYSYTTTECDFVYKDGKKIYKINEIDGQWYYLNDLDVVKYSGQINDSKDYSAKEYKESAKQFKEWINSNSILKSLVTPANAVKANGNKYDEFVGNNQTILISDTSDPESIFNQHKREVIKLSIQDNLNNAIAIYNDNSAAMGTDATFKMPKLTELEWEQILKNVNIVTFMQGIPMGNKLYNSYSVVTSTNNKQYVSPNSVYFISDIDGTTYHTINHIEEIGANVITGYKSTDYKKVKYEVNEEIKYYYRRTEYGCYECIVDTSNSKLDLSVLSGKTKKAYYTALARERYNLDKITRVFMNYNT